MRTTSRRLVAMATLRLCSLTLVIAGPAEMAHAASSLCGAAEATPDGIGSSNWASYACAARAFVPDDWDQCLSRAEYARTPGRGCPGRQKCCPERVVAASGRPAVTRGVPSDPRRGRRPRVADRGPRPLSAGALEYRLEEARFNRRSSVVGMSIGYITGLTCTGLGAWMVGDPDMEVWGWVMLSAGLFEIVLGGVSTALYAKYDREVTALEEELGYAAGIPPSPRLRGDRSAASSKSLRPRAGDRVFHLAYAVRF